MSGVATPAPATPAPETSASPFLKLVQEAKSLGNSDKKDLTALIAEIQQADATQRNDRRAVCFAAQELSKRVEQFTPAQLCEAADTIDVFEKKSNFVFKNSKSKPHTQVWKQFLWAAIYARTKDPKVASKLTKPSKLHYDSIDTNRIRHIYTRELDNQSQEAYQAQAVSVGLSGGIKSLEFFLAKGDAAAARRMWVTYFGSFYKIQQLNIADQTNKWHWDPDPSNKWDWRPRY